MAEVKCEECRSLQEDHDRDKRMNEIFGDKDRSFSWTIHIGDLGGGHKYTFDDSRGDISVHQIAMMIKLFLDSGSYNHEYIKPTSGALLS